MTNKLDCKWGWVSTRAYQEGALPCSQVTACRQYDLQRTPMLQPRADGQPAVHAVGKRNRVKERDNEPCLSPTMDRPWDGMLVCDMLLAPRRDKWPTFGFLVVSRTAWEHADGSPERDSSAENTAPLKSGRRGTTCQEVQLSTSHTSPVNPASRPSPTTVVLCCDARRGRL
ncbi:hypothetical protein K505DRAFT_12897 [Melanomma pulvis-pyrius CBS 109.77]|uniref:Uncharacterized protein n=1 Tax=Melanomma pulvis-pyrius CBS 109.77 TaxID=1314802 RepID=A0A6A6XG49_9PLEO|nr:hypothetical protein K505DRAFT_12897 [Melanomma pulvis-pyrius CBS 109.77]